MWENNRLYHHCRSLPAEATSLARITALLRLTIGKDNWCKGYESIGYLQQEQEVNSWLILAS